MNIRHIELNQEPVDIKIATGTTGHILATTSGLENSLSISLAKNSSLNFYRLTKLDNKYQQQSQSKIFLAQNSCLNFYDINLSHGQLNNMINVDLFEPQAQVKYYALDQLLGNSHSHTELMINHKAPHTLSEQSVRGIYAQQSQGFFMGRVIVDKYACQSSAKQRYKAVLLSDQAKAHVLPQLEINNFDIAAQHGASIGELDANSIFYLQSRGLSLIEAKTMLVKSFIADIINNIANLDISVNISQQIDEAINQALGLKS